MKKIILTVILSLTFILIFAFTPQNTRIFAQDAEYKQSLKIEEKIPCNVTIQEDFASDRVLVVLKKEVTKGTKTYTAEDFSEKGFEITGLTDLTAERQQLEPEKTDKGDEISDSEEKDIQPESKDFKTILQLDLSQKSKENVLETIKQLEKRDDILYAGPDYIMKFFSVPSPVPTYYSQQWAINKIQLEQAWDITIGSDSVTVGVDRKSTRLNSSH